MTEGQEDGLKRFWIISAIAGWFID